MNTTRGVSRREFLAGSAALGAGIVPAISQAASTQPAGRTSGESRWQIGCYTRPWADHEYQVALDAVAEAGFKYVGLMTTKSASRLVISAATTPDEAEQVAGEIRRRGLSVLSVYGGDIPVHESLEAGIAGLRRLIDNCATVRSASLLMGGVGDEKLYGPYYKAIAECCDYAAEKKLQITVKPHGGTNATGPQCRKCVEQVNHANFRLWYDPGNIFFYSNGELNPVEDAASVDGLVTGMCVKDYEHPKKVDVTPGTGKVDFPAVLARLRKGGLAGGPLVIECLTARDALPARLEEARQARAFLERITAGL